MKTLSEARWKVGDVVSLARWNQTERRGSVNSLPDVAPIDGVRCQQSQTGICYLVAGHWLDEAWLLPHGVQIEFLSQTSS